LIPIPPAAYFDGGAALPELLERVARKWRTRVNHRAKPVGESLEFKVNSDRSFQSLFAGSRRYFYQCLSLLAQPTRIQYLTGTILCGRPPFIE
jgi:hypothetical protein